MNRVLFVDDESALLENLRRRLYRAKSKWHMTFVDSGALALEQLKSDSYDVIVTDMRMASMDGAQLLELASEISPETIRIVLSGYTEERQVMRLVPLAHQYLAKPCKAERLEQLIDRSVRLKELLGKARVRMAVGRIRQLPVLPRVYGRLRDAMARDNASVAEVAQIIASDSAVTAKIMQVANSAFFRLARPISRIDQAVAHLGFAAIRSLALSAEVFCAWPQEAAPAAWLEPERLQQHSSSIAAGACALAGASPWALDALLAGLLHDIGYWVLLQQCPEELASAVALAEERGIALVEAERMTLDATHAEVGAYLLGLWGLPHPIVEAVAFHHNPLAAHQRDFGPLAALAIAEALMPACGAAHDRGRIAETRPDDSYLTTLGAPFGWAEAQQRLRELAEHEEPCDV